MNSHILCLFSIFLSYFYFYKIVLLDRRYLVESFFSSKCFEYIILLHSSLYCFWGELAVNLCGSLIHYEVFLSFYFQYFFLIYGFQYFKYVSRDKSLHLSYFEFVKLPHCAYWSYTFWPRFLWYLESCASLWGFILSPVGRISVLGN